MNHKELLIIVIIMLKREYKLILRDDLVFV